MDTPTRTTGLDLKLLRVSLDLSVREVTQAAGVSHRYFNRIEREARPSTRAVAKYFDAIAKCTAR